MYQDLWELCEKFMRDNDIHSVETIYQMDNVAFNALPFIEAVAELVGYAPVDEDRL